MSIIIITLNKNKKQDKLLWYHFNRHARQLELVLSTDINFNASLASAIAIIKLDLTSENSGVVFAAADTHLNVVQQAGGVHARGDVDRVAPDVVLRLAGADHTGNHRTNVDACAIT